MAKDKKDYLEGRKALQVFLDEETHLQFKTLCTLKGVKMTETAADMVKEWIEKESRSKPWVRNLK